MTDTKMMRQSSDLLRPQPARLAMAFLALVLSICPADAQDRYRVVQDENFRREPRPDGRRLASIMEDSEVSGDTVRSGWVRVTVEGWIWSRSLRGINSSGFDHEVSASSGENLRAFPNGDVIARLERGFRLREEARDGAWVRVSRTGWMWGRSLQRMSSQTVSGGSVTPEQPPASAPPVQGEVLPENVGLDFAVTAGAAVLRQTPDGDTTGTLKADAPVRIVGRSGEWVRVRTEGWVRESDLTAGSEGVLVGVSGAEVRAQPREFEGKLIQWTLQYIAVQVADDLRPEIPVGQKYMLARGPMPEAGFVYLLLDDSAVAALENVAPLAQLVVLARVRVGRTRYLGNPVLDAIDLSVRQP